ncbi:hypothetical protein GCM10022288_07030 [Gryllotalpicola kribbensis]|uniref:Uncharacterized protein n=1 Tax=Gryllotalpicola kribbensis TaxID=993084 RepID=A0ABP8AK22_9MICO
MAVADTSSSPADTTATAVPGADDGTTSDVDGTPDELVDGGDSEDSDSVDQDDDDAFVDGVSSVEIGGQDFALTTTPPGNTNYGSPQGFGQGGVHTDATVKAIAPANWPACGYNVKESKLVHEYIRLRVRGGGGIEGTTAALRCGTDKYGYFHILDAHMSQWASVTPSSLNWRDVANWSMDWILSDPDKATYNTSQQTWCFSRTVYLVKNNKTVVATMTPHVGLGKTAQRIITAFPAGSQCTGTNLVK